MSEAPIQGFTISVEADYVLLRVERDRTVTAEMLISMLKELYSLQAYRSEKRAGLWDFRGCSTDLDYQGMKRVKEYIDAHYDPSWTHSITALVADKDVLYGLSRMYDSLTSTIPTELNIFREFEQAERWIGEQIS
jgi:hypothetical protein